MILEIELTYILSIVAVTIIGLPLFLYWQNNGLITNKITFKNKNIPPSFDGYKIVHLSDFHNKDFGTKQNSLVKKIKKIQPDIIVVTGDLIDARNTKIDVAMALIREVMKIAPIFYVSGNHEARSGQYDQLKFQLQSHGVIVLDNEAFTFLKENESIDIIGLSDIAFENHSSLEHTLHSLTEKSNNFTILLSHRPELLDTYANSDVDLVFSGHAHGGQIRIPFVGGIFAPSQGFFPKLAEGVHTRNTTTIIISRGLGNSLFPWRIWNRPEIVVVTLAR